MWLISVDTNYSGTEFFPLEIQGGIILPGQKKSAANPAGKRHGYFWQPTSRRSGAGDLVHPVAIACDQRGTTKKHHQISVKPIRAGEIGEVNFVELIFHKN
jgi:hypothetical protein